MDVDARAIEEALTAPEFGDDPYPAYHRMLELDAPFWSEARQGWMICRHEDVINAFRDFRHFSSEGRVEAMLDHFSEDEWEQLGELHRYAELRGIIHRDPPDHTRLRRAVVSVFTRGAVEKLRARVHEVVDELLDDVQDDGEMDVVRDLAHPLPVAVITEMLGVPRDDRDLFVQWSDAALGLQGKSRPTLEVALAAQEGYVNLQRYFAQLIAERREHPGGEDDLLTSLIRSHDQEEGFTDRDLVQTCLTLLMGGYETTTSLITNTMVLLLQHPEVRDQILGNPDLMAPTIEESLRYESPIQTVTRRVAEDVEVGKTTLREGDLAIVVIGAANRDPRRFEDPDRFDIHREDRHVAFGSGAHFCLGAALARLEGPVAIQTVLDRMPELELADERIHWNREKTVIRCPTRLNVSF